MIHSIKFSNTLNFFVLLKPLEAKLFAEKPIIFGDFMKMGAEKSERLYEEITDYEKLKSVFGDVTFSASYLTMNNIIFVNLILIQLN